MRRSLAVACAVLLVSLAFISAEKSSALINEAMDKLYKLEITQNTPLQQVLKRITDETSVPVQVSGETWDLLPYGEGTALTVKIENQTLGGGLKAIARSLGLSVEVKDEVVELVPMPALKRIGKRASVDELRALDYLARTPLDLKGVDRVTVKDLLGKIDAKLAGDEKANGLAVENRSPDVVGDAAVPIARNDTITDALETIAQSTDATWYPWGKTIVVRPKADHFRDLLGKTTTRRWNGVDVGQVLAELHNISGVPFVIEPGAVARIPPESRNIRLVLDAASISQALENIAGFTGLAWTVNEKGVYVWNPSNSSGAGAAANREPTIGLLTLDNGVQVVLRESQVPADLREYVKHKTQQQFEKMRQQMKDEGFKPAATQPAATRATTKPNEDL